THASGRSAARLEDVRFESPVKLHRDEPIDAQVHVRLEGESARVQVVTEFVGATGKHIVREHFRCKVLFGARVALQRPKVARLEMPRDPQITSEDVYKRYFHGPVFQVLGEVTTIAEDGVEAKTPKTWSRWLDNVAHE